MCTHFEAPASIFDPIWALPWRPFALLHLHVSAHYVFSDFAIFANTPKFYHIRHPLHLLTRTHSSGLYQPVRAPKRSLSSSSSPVLKSNTHADESRMMSSPYEWDQLLNKFSNIPDLLRTPAIHVSLRRCLPIKDV